MLRSSPRRGTAPRRRADPKRTGRPRCSCRLPESARGGVSVCTVSDCLRGAGKSSALAPANTGRQQQWLIAASTKGLLIMQADTQHGAATSHVSHSSFRPDIGAAGRAESHGQQVGAR
jgi:hypothetical protein